MMTRGAAPPCETCNQRVLARKKPGVTCVGCLKAQHFDCLSIPLEDQSDYTANIKVYHCKTCKTKHRMSMTFVASPTTTTKTTSATTSANTSRTAAKANTTVGGIPTPTPTPTVPEPTPLAESYLQQTNHLLAIITSLQETVKNLETKLESALDEIRYFKESGQTNCSNNKKHSTKRRTPLHRGSSDPKTRTFSINGLVRKDTENIREVVSQLITKLDVNFELADDTRITELPNAKLNSPSTILVSADKDSVNVKTFVSIKGKKLDPNLLGLKDCKALHFNENHPSAAYKLYKEAKLLKSNGYKFVWIQAGRVLARQEPGGKITQVKDHEHLSQLIHPSP